MPGPRTGAWAILVALEAMTARSPSDQFSAHKQQIVAEAAQHCACAMLPPRGARGGWEGNKTLITHELITRDRLSFRGEATGKGETQCTSTSSLDVGV
jgi:hypothetical protein